MTAKKENLSATELTVKNQPARSAEHLKPYQFKPGQSGNPAGRPKGARSELDSEFVTALLNDFRENGIDAIKSCRSEKPETYLSVITKVLPKVVEGQVDHNHEHNHKSESVSETAEWLNGIIGSGPKGKAKKPVSH